MAPICTHLMIAAVAAITQQGSTGSIEKLLGAKLPSLGHRNWIVVADSAYPLQTAPGIETITVSDSQVAVVKQVLNALSKTKHVKPNIYVDKELSFVPEELAPGITSYRNSLDGLLKGRAVQRSLHEEIIAMLDEAGKTFKVLLIKTPHVQPYTSVFFQLDCGYWSAESEAKLRERMKGGR